MRQFSVVLSAVAMLATSVSCDSSSSNGVNPLLEAWSTPFEVPPFDEIKPEHYMPAFLVAMDEHNAEIQAILDSEQAPTFDNVVLAYDNAGALLSKVTTIYSMISSAETNEAIQAIKNESTPLFSSHNSAISLNADLFAKIKVVYDSRLDSNLDDEQIRLVEKIYTSFVRNGALLSDEDKALLKTIDSELSMLSVKFSSNVLAENNKFTMAIDKTQLGGLPKALIASAKEKAEALGLKDKWLFTPHSPSWIPFLTYSTERDLRKELYMGYISRGNYGDELDNNQIINDMVRLRSQKAQLLGYSDYSDFVVSNEMAGSTDSVYALLDEIWTPALERAKGELSEMEKLFKKDYPGETFSSWDWWYYAEALRKEKYDLDESMLSPYFALSNVQNGIFTLCNRLYGITFRPVALPRYHEDCVTFEVLDVDNSHLGILYMDFHPRAGKKQGAWCGRYRSQGYDESGERISPIVSIVCNFSSPAAGEPALLTLDETETFFHEFGHALHSLFSEVKYKGLSRVEGDFVELPSQIMENWAFEPELLKQYAVHYRTKEVIPDALIEKIRRSSLFNQGFATTELAAAALADLDIHTIADYKPFDVEAFEVDALNTRRGLISQIEPRYHYTYFSHIFAGGYSSGYYFYLWAEVLDKDAFAAFAESGDLFNKKLAESFRYNVLARGGSEPGMTMYTKFRGAAPNKDAMLEGRGLK